MDTTCCCCDTNVGGDLYGGYVEPAYEAAPIYDAPVYEPVYEAAPVYEAPGTMVLGGPTEPDFTIVGGYEAPTGMTLGGTSDPGFSVVGGYEAPAATTVGGSWSPGSNDITVLDPSGAVVGVGQLGTPMTGADVGLVSSPVALPVTAPTHEQLNNQMVNSMLARQAYPTTMAQVNATLSSMPGLTHYDYSPTSGTTTIHYY
jgi:hypothetical protein